MSKAASDGSIERAKRAARREERASASEQREPTSVP